jgi:hypothetical protein
MVIISYHNILKKSFPLAGRRFIEKSPPKIKGIIFNRFFFRCRLLVGGFSVNIATKSFQKTYKIYTFCILWGGLSFKKGVVFLTAP